MKFIEILNIPSPSTKLVELTINIVNSSATQNTFKENVSNLVIKDNSINVADSGQVTNDLITKLVREEYQHFFNVDIGATVSFFKNSSTRPCCLPPHTHSIRTLALNYYIMRGGNNVNTTLYKFNPTVAESKFSNYYPYTDVEYIGHAVCNNPHWYAFESKLPHSVDNIETTRALLAITFDPLCDLATITRQPNIEYKIIL